GDRRTAAAGHHHLPAPPLHGRSRGTRRPHRRHRRRTDRRRGHASDAGGPRHPTLHPLLPVRRIAANGNGRLHVSTSDPLADTATLAAWAGQNHVPLRDLEVRRPSLEEIYLELTEGDRA